MFLLYTEFMERGSNRRQDVWALLLVLVALWVSVLRLVATRWVDHLARVETLVVLGFLLGTLLGQSAFKRPVCAGMAVIFSLFCVTWQIGLTLERQGIWLNRLSTLAARLNVSWFQFINNQPVADPILFLTSMAALYWTLSLLAGYWMARYRRPWLPLLVAGAALLIIDHYDPLQAHRSRYTGIFVFCVLFIAGRLYYLRSRQNWEEKGIAVDMETASSLVRGVLVGAFLLVVLAWNLPTIFETLTPGSEAQQRLVASWQSFRNRMSNAFAGLRGPVGQEMYSRYLELGTGAALGDEVLFTVSASSGPSQGVRYYWRGASYDRYEGGRWQNTVNTAMKIEPQAWPLRYPYPSLLGRQKVELVFSMGSRLAHTVYAPSLPVYLNRPVEAIGETVGEDGALDLVTLLAKPTLSVGEKVQALAWVSAPTVEQLRSAGQDYPDWVKSRYLQLPDDFPKSVGELAREVTAGQETAYDKVMAITAYLRQNIAYQPQVPLPPTNRDPIEWFLFEYKGGFCNYYASAEVLMLRSVGIPARMVTGYAAGFYDPQQAEYRVRVMDSHAWPEVFFPGIGWVEFEPTASQPPTSFLSGRETPSGDNLIPGGPEEEGGFASGGPAGGNTDDIENVLLGPEDTLWQRWLGPFALFLGVGAIGAAGMWIWRHLERKTNKKVPVLLERYLAERGMPVPWGLSFWARWSQLSPIERLFTGVPWMLTVLGARREAGQTPAEQIAAIVNQVPQADRDGKELLQEYQLAIFSPHPYDLQRAHAAYRHLWKIVLASRIKGLMLAVFSLPGLGSR